MTPVLHYYFNESLLSYLKRGTLPVEQDWSILEPYLSFSAWTEGHSQVSEAEILAGLRAEYKALPENIRALLAFDDFLLKRDQFEPAIKKRLLANRPRHQDGYHRGRFEKTAFMQFFDSATCDFGWRTLGQNFSGVCLAVKSTSSFLSAKKGKPVFLSAVRYGQHHNPINSAENPVPGAFHDSAENQARGEWRAIMPTSALERLEVKLAKGDLTSIYISVNASEQLKTEVNRLVQMDLRYRQVKLLEVVPDRSEWKLTARLLPTPESF